MNEALIEELKELASLVRRGRLFDVQAWLKSGKPYGATASTKAWIDRGEIRKREPQ
jgi:hypothetical protein